MISLVLKLLRSGRFVLGCGLAVLAGSWLYMWAIPSRAEEQAWVAAGGIGDRPFTPAENAAFGVGASLILLGVVLGSVAFVMWQERRKAQRQPA